MPRLLLVRHGDTDFNQRRRFMGHTDIGLSALGVKQVERLKEYIADENISAIYASDLSRTMKTATILRDTRRVEIVPCPELRELNYGDCEGLSFGQIGEKFPEVAAKCTVFSLDLDFPGGEDYRSFIKRTLTFLKRLKQTPGSETVLVVSHSGPIKILLCHLLGLPMKYSQRLHLETASLSSVYFNPPNNVLTRFNDISYLKDLG